MALILKALALLAALVRLAALVNAGTIFLSAVTLEPSCVESVEGEPASSAPLPHFTGSSCTIALGGLFVPGPAPPAATGVAGQAVQLAAARPPARPATPPLAKAPPAPAPAPPSQGAAGLVRDEPYWVETVNGIQTIPAGNDLRVWTLGPVSLVGDETGTVRYTLVKRVKASSEAQARRMLDAFIVRTGSSGKTTTLEVAHDGGGGHSAEIRVRVPRALRAVAIETHGGNVEASGLDGALTAATGGGRMTVAGIGGRVEATTAGGEIDLDAVQGSVKCTSAGGRIRAGSIRGDAEFQTGGGDIHVREAGGLVRAVTAGGDILIRRARGEVSANTAGGAIQIDEALGQVKAETLGGSIQIGSAAGVRCETAGGGIRLTDVSGEVRASTAVGNVFAQLASGRLIKTSYLATNAGDITVTIPAGAPLTIRAENQRSGRARAIVSDFPGIRISNRGLLSLAEGSINGGGPVLRLSALNGTIYIRKKQE